MNINNVFIRCRSILLTFFTTTYYVILYFLQKYMDIILISCVLSDKGVTEGTRIILNILGGIPV